MTNEVSHAIAVDAAIKIAVTTELLACTCITVDALILINYINNNDDEEIKNE
jgi:hypothetical protein